VAKDWVARTVVVAERLLGRHPRRVVNATGVVLHTNLGRAPLAEGAARAAFEASVGYSNLELDLESGRRGNRTGALAEKLRLLAGAEAAHACNNNAAAVMLALDTLARGREVIVSRGELVEIGGSFRVPDIIERAGVRLVEVGTTNRTHPLDYEQAIGPNTALLLKVHRSNFEQTGFVTEVELPDLVRIGGARGVPVVEDLGSGTLVDLTPQGLPPECFVPSRVRQGADVVCFSGDKLLGGPQAGLSVGRREPIEAMRRNPLARALRLDKMTLAALDWTATAYLDGRALQEIPVLRHLLEPLDSLERRAHALATRLDKCVASGAANPSDWSVEVLRERSPVGGGSLPGFLLDSWVVALRGAQSAARTAARLRSIGEQAADPDDTAPVLTRVRDDTVLLDVRTLEERDFADVEAALCA
jgi:L-seryl-tRNA(Ser) seleniumtransferase